MGRCKDCIHFGICKKGFPFADGKGGGWCEDFKDRSRFVELPCKVGDIVYINGIMGVGKAEKHRVKYASYYNVRGKETWFFEADLVCDAPGVNDCGFCATAIGKTVFLNREEAEAALAERREGV